MNILFYLGIILLSAGLYAAGCFVAYNIGKKRGAKEYYNLLTNPVEIE